MDRKFIHIIWFLITVISLLLISSILIFTFYNGENKSVVSHLSLASSIISIILAVLAIVYTYFQNASVQNTTNNMKEEVGKLSKLIENFNTSADKLNTLDSLLQLMNTNVQDIRAIKEALVGQAINSSKDQDTTDTPNESRNNEDVSRNTAETTEENTNTPE